LGSNGLTLTNIQEVNAILKKCTFKYSKTLNAKLRLSKMLMLSKYNDSKVKLSKIDTFES
jgi:hypothetical protein